MPGNVPHWLNKAVLAITVIKSRIAKQLSFMLQIKNYTFIDL